MKPMRPWIVALLVVAATAFFAIAVSRSAYDIVTPGGWPLHVFARKVYSLAAFVVLGFLLVESRGAASNRRTIALAAISTAFYSACIEVAQFFAGSHEGLRSNFIDVGFGFVGGFIGSTIAALLRRREV